MDAKLLFPICTLILWTCVSAGGAGQPCTTDEDCTVRAPGRKKRGRGAFRPYCETFSGECVECLIDAVCANANPGRPFCRRGLTPTCVECRDDGDCDEPTPLCVDGDCTSECIDDTNCGDNEKCDIARGLCVCENDDDPCNDDNESCDEDGNCSCDPGFVRESENSDFCIADCDPPCGAGEVCGRNKECECGPTTIRGPSDECVPCPECRDDGNCDEPTPLCVDGDCTSECIDDTNCGDNEKCDIARGLCVCENDDDPCNDDNESCDEDGNCSCDLGFVRESENSDFCIADCDPPCGPGEVCGRDKECECGPTTVRGPSDECVPCQPECSTSSDCEIEGEVCNSRFECECPSMEKLFRGKCVKRGRLGGWCKPGGRCQGRMLKCNRSTNMCMCRGSNCEARTVCVKRRI